MRSGNLGAGSSAVLYLERLGLCMVYPCISLGALFLFEEETMSHIIVTKGVQEYRQTIPHCVTKQDVVLEIGCGCGKTSSRLYRYAKYVVAIDKGKALPIAKKNYPHIHFEQIDGFDISRVRQLGCSFTKVYIDISGCRDIYDVIKMVNMYEAVFQPELIVVKSTKLKRLVSKCVVWDGNDMT
jgi:2-polyprenyl-3-methyl-5-hydroxy-6-metoxy-1,4-benzoquinol methylase